MPDDYEKIQWAVDNATAGDTIIVSDGTYYENVSVDKQLIIRSENGSANCIVDAGGLGSAFNLSADEITIEGFTITNSTEKDWRAAAGIKIVSNYSTITNNNISSNNEDGIYLDESSNNNITNNNISNNDGSGLYGSSNNNITNNNISSNNRDGIYLRGSNNKVSSNNISNNGAGIYLYLYDSGNNTITNNIMTNNGISLTIEDRPLKYWNNQTIEGNTVNTKPIYYLKNQVGDKVPEDAGQVILANCTGMKIENLSISDTDVGIQLGFSFQNIIEDNNVSNNGDGIELYQSSNNTITSNNIASNNHYGIEHRASSNNTITSNNNISNNSYGIYLDGSDNINISSNNISFNDPGIYLYHSSNNTITSNNISFNDRAIYLKYSDNNNIASNNIFNNSGFAGIKVVDSHYNNITSNNIFNNSLNGINIEGGIPDSDRNNNIITSNNIISNGEHGVYIMSSYYNIITSNNITSNGEHGVYISSSYPNVVYLNNFIDNTNNAYSNGESKWNSTSPIAYTYNGNSAEKYLGNYWSDYTGSDSDEDGIGDTPYSFDGGEDSYPLMERFENYSLTYGNTPTGNDVTVTNDPVTVTYENVDSEGITSVTSQEGNPSDDPPSGFRFRSYFVDISTTADYSGTIEVCIDYTGLITGDEEDLRLMHWDGSEWDDVTTSLDTTNNIICGQVTSLSPFGIASTTSEPVGGEVSTVNKIELMLPYVVVSALALILGMGAYALRKQ